MASEGNKGVALLILLVLMATFFTVLFNIPPANLLHIGFGDINGVASGFWIILLRLIISPLVVGASGWAMWKIIKD